MVNRRQYLAAGTALLPALTGCSSGALSNGEPDSDDASGGNSPTERPPETDRRTVTIGSVDDVDTGDVSVEVSLLRTAVTPDGTARLRVTTTNRGPPRDLSVGEDECSIFNRDHGESSPRGLRLRDPGSSERMDRAGDRWTLDRDPEKPLDVPAYGCTTFPYETDESVASEYLVWDDYRTAGYMKPGAYRFERGITVYEYDDTNTAESPDPLDEFRWGFEVEVETP